MGDYTYVFALIGAIIILGFVAEWAFRRTGVPDILALMLLGFLIGPVFRVSDPTSMAAYAPIFAPIVLMILLFDGGLQMNIKKVVYATPKAGFFGLLNVVFAMFVGAIFMKIALGWDFQMGAVLGAIVGGTSSAIVMPIVQRIKISEETRDLLSIESIVTDVLCIVAVIAVLDVMQAKSSNLLGIILSAFSIGIMMGLVGGIIWLYLTKRFNGLSYMLTLASIFVLYSFSESVGGSGAISALLFGLVLGHREEFSKLLGDAAQKEQEKTSLKLMQTEISFFVKTFFFVYLGMLVSVGGMDRVAIGISLVLLLIAARYIATRIITIGAKPKETAAFMATMAPRGLAAAVLAQVPFSRGLDPGREITDLVFVVIVATVLLVSLSVFYFGRKNEKEQAPLTKLSPVYQSIRLGDKPR